MRKLTERPVLENHKCNASRFGDWIIFECPECDYQLWENVLTGETKFFNIKKTINHSGFYNAKSDQ